MHLPFDMTLGLIGLLKTHKGHVDYSFFNEDEVICTITLMPSLETNEKVVSHKFRAPLAGDCNYKVKYLIPAYNNLKGRLAEISALESGITTPKAIKEALNWPSSDLPGDYEPNGWIPPESGQSEGYKYKGGNK